MALLTQCEAAQVAGRPYGTIRAWTSRGVLPVALRVSGRPYYRREDVVRVAEAMKGTKGRPCRDEPTEEELEAMIAEQMKPENLPTWWFSDVEMMRGRRRAA